LEQLTNPARAAEAALKIQKDKSVSKEVAEEIAVRVLRLDRKFTKKAALAAILAPYSRSAWDQAAIEGMNDRVPNKGAS